MAIYYSRNGTRIEFSQSIGKGGEGEVFGIRGMPSTVAKILDSNKRTRERERKLEIMVQRPPEDACQKMNPPHFAVCWPRDLLYENNGFAGFLMPKISSVTILFNAYNRSSRREKFPDWDTRYSYRVAYNLAKIFQGLHAQRYVIGDVNQKNFLVFPNALVTMIDADSIQVRDNNGKVFPCVVGMDEFIAPELRGTDFQRTIREPYHDNFSLAILIFLLLMEGFHPFNGIPANTNAEIPDNMTSRCMEYGIFPYYHTDKCLPSPNSPPFSMLDPQLRNLFIRAFVKGHQSPSLRPSASEWALTLNKVERNLIQCTTNEKHWFSMNY